MADKKETAAPETAKTETAATETAKTEKMVKIRIPKTKKDQPPQFVSINERTWLIQPGVEVEVPECVAVLLREQEAMREKYL